MEKALCVYLNSSIGVLALLGNRTNREISYPRFSSDDLIKLVVPNFAVIGEAAVAKLATAYDAHAADVLLPLPQMDADPVRARAGRRSMRCAEPGRRAGGNHPPQPGRRAVGNRQALLRPPCMMTSGCIIWRGNDPQLSLIDVTVS